MNQVRKYTLAYLGRKITLEDFLDWLADATSPVVDLGLDANEKSLASEIELPAAELTGGHISEDTFRILLHALVTHTIITFYAAASYSAQSWQTATTEPVQVIPELLEACA